jgi:hypothetical protein
MLVDWGCAAYRRSSTCIISLSVRVKQVYRPFAHSFHGSSASGRKLLERLSLRYDLRYDLWPTQFVKG